MLSAEATVEQPILLKIHQHHNKLENNRKKLTLSGYAHYMSSQGRSCEFKPKPASADEESQEIPCHFSGHLSSGHLYLSHSTQSSNTLGDYHSFHPASVLLSEFLPSSASLTH